MASVLKIKDSAGNWISVPAIKGEKGEDGVSPEASVEKSGKVATITITDASGTTTAQVSDGNDGQDGQDGDPGAAAGFGTPSATITDNTPGTPEVIITASGEDTAKVFSFNFKHIKGDRGFTPEKGTDYFTDDEIEEIEEEVKEAVIDDMKWSDIKSKPFVSIGANLQVQSGVLSVQTTDAMEADNTKPITSKGTYVVVGNIDSLLEALL